MSNKVEISEIEVVDTYYLLNLSSSYVRDPKKIDKRLTDLFAHFDLKIAKSNSNLASYKTIQSRYTRIVQKIDSNKSCKRDKHFGFIPEKLFFCESEMPDLCTKENSTAR